ncbi:BEL1-like homeodomain protein 1 isoform E [Glycine soja]|uniref:BEL1-like homeodomain protein 1 isoform D n=1 Tax=Glycine soja TaxID=3848 RepID=A0A445HSB4_GLYSO|nr:BEL1-like homeodomain protein 1 isoform D [Glycine soja]RZB76566.1 BEL1-like homeodomain protein 1 isoform E [Glycine soja]
MAMYFHGSTSEIQPSSADGGLQTLYLMNPTYVPYADAPHHPTALLVNPNALNLANIPHAPPVSPNHQQQQHVIHGMTNILGSGNSDDHSRPSLFGENIASFHGFSGGGSASATAPRLHYNLWGPVVDHPGTPSSSSGGGGFRRSGQQGLSLSLSSQQTNFRSVSGELDVAGQGNVAGIGNSPTSASTGVSGVIMGSNYLKAAQELLDEAVNVGKGIYKEEKFAEKVKANRESTNSGAAGGGDGSSGGGENSAGKQVVELSTAQRQELQMKKSKLVSMLDEVEQRYRQYHHQMQIVVSSFEQAAGYGAAKSYTALALKTISKQFRCLKDAISAQIKATSKTLGEDDCLGVKVEGSRLRYVDHHLRQQRALQQLGMIQPNAWRPQRGLPERAVSILRAWLFEHFLHPYVTYFLGLLTFVFILDIQRTPIKLCLLNKLDFLGARCQTGLSMPEFGFGSQWLKKCTWKKSRNMNKVMPQKTPNQRNRARSWVQQQMLHPNQVPLNSIISNQSKKASNTKTLLQPRSQQTLQCLQWEGPFNPPLVSILQDHLTCKLGVQRNQEVRKFKTLQVVYSQWAWK